MSRPPFSLPAVCSSFAIFLPKNNLHTSFGDLFLKIINYQQCWLILLIDINQATMSPRKRWLWPQFRSFGLIKISQEAEKPPACLFAILRNDLLTHPMRKLTNETKFCLGVRFQNLWRVWVWAPPTHQDFLSKECFYFHARSYRPIMSSWSIICSGLFAKRVHFAWFVCILCQ